MTEALYRVILPNGDKTKPYSKAKSSQAFDAGKIHPDAVVDVDGSRIDVGKFCETKRKAKPKPSKRMTLEMYDCPKCGASIAAESSASVFECEYCGCSFAPKREKASVATAGNFAILAKRAISREQFGKALQLIEQGLLLSPHDEALLALEAQCRTSLGMVGAEAAEGLSTQSLVDQAHNRAQGVLSEYNINMKVYGTNNKCWLAYNHNCDSPADLDLGIRACRHVLSLDPSDPSGDIHNTLGLLLIGNGEKEEGTKALETAAEKAPSDFTIQENLKSAKSDFSGCAVLLLLPLIGFIPLLRRLSFD